MPLSRTKSTLDKLYDRLTNLNLILDHVDVELAVAHPRRPEGRVEQHGELEPHPADESDPPLLLPQPLRRLEGDCLAADAVLRRSYSVVSS